MTLPARFFDKVEERDGCLVWTGAIGSSGYGSWRPGGREIPAQSTHVAVWEDANGPVPEGMTLDHVRARGCWTRACCRLDHLEVVTRGENVLRGDSPPAVNARKTRCASGHPFDEANTYVTRQGRRHCRACNNIRQNERRRKIRAA